MRGFEIREQPYFLERRERHALRFLDEHRDLPVLRVALEQVAVQHLHHFEVAGVARRRELQLARDRVQDFIGRYAGIGEIDGFDVRRQPRLQHVAQHGLAAADFPGDLDDAFALADGVNQCIENRAAVAAGVEKLGVGRDAKRRPGKPEMGVIHNLVYGVVNEQTQQSDKLKRPQNKLPSPPITGERAGSTPLPSRERGVLFVTHCGGLCGSPGAP